MTERAEHTAGPWEFESDETSSGTMFTVYDKHGTRLSDAYIDETPARLIAAAPDLLAALQTLSAEEWRDDDDPILSAARNQARAAISKATGES